MLNKETTKKLIAIAINFQLVFAQTISLNIDKNSVNDIYNTNSAVTEKVKKDIRIQLEKDRLSSYSNNSYSAKSLPIDLTNRGVTKPNVINLNNKDEYKNLKNNYLTKEELLKNIDKKSSFGQVIKKDIFNKNKKDIIYKASVTTNNITYDYNNNLFIKLGKKSKDVLLEDLYSINNTDFKNNIQLEEPLYSCLSDKYKLFSKIKINPNTKSEYVMNVKIKYKIDKSGDRTIASFTDVLGKSYKKVVIKNTNYIINSNRSFVKKYSYEDAEKVCIRILAPNDNQTCYAGYKLNSTGVCEKKFTNQPSPRKTTGDYYTCKEQFDKNKVRIATALNKNLQDNIKKDCSNLPVNNDRVFYSNKGDAVCINDYKDTKDLHQSITKFRYITNLKDVEAFKATSCKWNVIGNYKVYKNTPLSNNQLYSIVGENSDVKIPELKFLEKGHTYAFILVSSGTAKLNKHNGLKRTSDYDDKTTTTAKIDYKGNKYTTLLNIDSNAIFNGIKYLVYENMSELDTVYNDYNEIYANYKTSIDLGSLEESSVYELNINANTLSKINNGYNKGHIEYSTGKIYINGHTEKDQFGSKYVDGGYFSQTTKNINGYIYAVDKGGKIIDKNLIYVDKNTDVESKIETETSFSKIVLQDTFVYTGKAQTIIKKPSKNWNFKLFIYDVNELNKIYSYMNKNYYKNKKVMEFNDYTKKSTHLFKQEFSDAACSNANLDASFSKKCIVKTVLFKTNESKIAPVLKNNTCYTYFTYDNNNSQVATILANLKSKSKIVENINSNIGVFYDKTQLNTKLLGISNFLSSNSSLFLLNNISFYDNLAKIYNINTVDGKAELDAVKDTMVILEKSLKDLSNATTTIVDKLKDLPKTSVVTRSDAFKLQSSLSLKAIKNYVAYKDLIDTFYEDTFELIKKYEFKDEYGDEYSIFLNNFYTDIKEVVNDDLSILLNQYNLMIEDNVYFIDDVFSETLTSNNKTIRTLLSGQTVDFGLKLNITGNSTPVSYKPSCTLNGSKIDCDDEILKSNNICSTKEPGDKTFCPSGTTWIGGSKCMPENCSIGYAFRKIPYKGSSYLGCVKEDNGTKGCVNDVVTTKSSERVINYSLKYIKENNKNELKCSSTPIFPNLDISDVTVSASLSTTFKFDGHTAPTSLKVNKVSYEYDKEKEEFNMSKLEGSMFYSLYSTWEDVGEVNYEYKLGYDYLLWTKSLPSVNGKGSLNVDGSKYICHHCGYPDEKWWYTYRVALTSADYSSIYATTYSTVQFKKDLEDSQSMKMTFDCNNVINNGKVEMYPDIGKNNKYTIAKSSKTDGFNIFKIKASSMPVWCVNVKPLDGCSNYDKTIKTCLVVSSRIKPVTTDGVTDKYCYLNKPTLTNSCKSVMFEYRNLKTAKCDIYNGFKENSKGECVRYIYNKAIKNKDYYCSIVPDRFNPFDGGQASFEIESLKNIANDSSDISSKSINFDIAIDSVSITSPIKYTLNNKPFNLYSDKTLPAYKAKSIKYYRTENNKDVNTYVPKTNLHSYKKIGNSLVYTYKNDNSKPGQYNGFLLNKELNETFNFNEADEKYNYQKNIFNVHLEDEIYEKYNVRLTERFGLVKNQYKDLTPSSLDSKYKCLYNYSVFQLPDCNQGLKDNEKSQYNMQFLNGRYICSIKNLLKCAKGYYEKDLKKCVISTQSSCPIEITKDGKTYRKSAGEIKEIKLKDGSLKCQLKKLKCDDLSIEGTCPNGFEYKPFDKNEDFKSSCVLKDGITNVPFLTQTLNNKIKISTVKICKENKTLNYYESKLPATLKTKTSWKINRNNICERNNYINSTKNKNIHFKYNLSPVLNIPGEFKRYNILSTKTFRNNETNLNVSILSKDGYITKKSGIKYLSLPVLIKPLSKNEDVIFTLTGFGKPDYVAEVNTDKKLGFSLLLNTGDDIIKGFNDTDTMAISQIINTDTPRLVIYSWRLSNIDKTKKINYFCENAICGIIEVNNQLGVNGHDIDVFEKINNKKTVDSHITNFLYNNCATSEYKFQEEYFLNKKSVKACFGIEKSDLKEEKDIKILKQISKVDSFVFKTINSKETILTDVSFASKDRHNYLCDYETGWSLIKKSYKISKIEAKTTTVKANTDYYKCQKEKTVNNEKIILEKDINTINTYANTKSSNKITIIKTNKPLTVVNTNPTDNKCYYGLMNNDTTNNDTTTVDDNAIIATRTLSSTVSASYVDKIEKNFVMNIEDNKMYFNDVAFNMNTYFENNTKPYYCISGNDFLNTSDSVSIITYSDLASKTSQNYQIIKEYDNTVSSNEIINYTIPNYISNIIVKEHNNRPPSFKKVTYKDYINNKLTTKYKNLLLYNDNKDKVENNKKGEPSLIDLTNLSNDREICIAFDLSKLSSFYDTNKNKFKNVININKTNKQKVARLYMAIPKDCEFYIKDFTTAFVNSNSLVKHLTQNFTLVKPTDFKTTLSKTELEDKENLCFNKVKCPTNYLYNSVNKTCESDLVYIPNKYRYTEDYYVGNASNEKIVTIETSNVNKSFENITNVINGKKIPGSLKSILVCDNGSIPIGNTCTETKEVKASCPTPFYSTNRLVDYKIYDNNIFNIATSADSYYCSFERPYEVKKLTIIMPKIKIK
jgi:hypothetical protein